MGDVSGALTRGELKEEESPFHLTSVDKWVLSQTDETFQLHQWEGLKEIIGEQRAAIISSCGLGFPLLMKWLRFRECTLSHQYQVFLEIPVVVSEEKSFNAVLYATKRVLL